MNSRFFIAVFAALCPGIAPASGNSLSLAGTWNFRLDRQDQGLAERWFAQPLPDKVRLPGSLPGQGIGDEVTLETQWTGGAGGYAFFTAPEYAPYRQPGNIKIPFWLQPEKYYVGAAWYQRELEIPSEWKGCRLVLTLERPRWETRVWLDEQPFGANNSLSVPHEYDLGTAVPPGHHRLTLCVDNRRVVDIGHNSCSISDHTEGNWNGILGRLELTATSPVWIADAQVYPDLGRKSAWLKVRVGNCSGRPGAGKLTAQSRSVAVAWDAQGGECRMEIPLGDAAQPWDEFHPILQRLKVRLTGDQADDEREMGFGLREIAARGTQFILNGQKIFIRATCECGVFPRTGHPPMDVEAWKRQLRILKEHGLNSIRFHCWFPPEAALVAADELGVYCIADCATWPGLSTTLGDGQPVDSWSYAEANRILRRYGNHPSFLLMALGCEPGGKRYTEFLDQWVSHFKSRDPRRLFTGTSGWPENSENQWHLVPGPRVQHWGEGMKSRINARPPETRTDYREFVRARRVPVISNEMGQWCVYPNFDEIPKYTGYLKPKNFEIFRDFLDAHHLGHQARQFLMASGKLQVLCYKEDIESALRTPGLGGLLLLGLTDFPGQGTAPVGILDAFWDDKGYVSPAQFRRFCHSTVLLARLDKRVFTSAENLRVDLEVAHFGPAPLNNATAAWKLVADDNTTVASGQLPARIIPVDNGTSLGSLDIPLHNLPALRRYKLVAALQGTTFENDWDVWVYPPRVATEAPPGVTIADALNDEAHAVLNQGGKVLLLIPPHLVKNSFSNKVVLGFSSVFWNTAFTRRQPPTTLGILCDPAHPALAQFPTDSCSNWQWWYLISRAGVMILDDLPPGLQPAVQVIDDWFTARRLGLVFEARVGAGKLLVCSIGLRKDLDQNPVARQMLHSLLDYMAGTRFKPDIEVSVERVRNLIAEPAGLWKLGASSITASSEASNYEAGNAIDGDPTTIWHTEFGAAAPKFPHSLVVEFVQPIAITGCKFLPRQDGHRNGFIKNYAIYVSRDGRDWGLPVAQGSFGNSAIQNSVVFDHPVQAGFLKFVALSGFDDNPFASLAEFELMQP